MWPQKSKNNEKIMTQGSCEQYCSALPILWPGEKYVQAQICQAKSIFSFLSVVGPILRGAGGGDVVARVEPKYTLCVCLAVAFQMFLKGGGYSEWPLQASEGHWALGH